MQRQKNNFLTCLVCALILFISTAFAVQPTPEQIEQFKSLPVEQQKALAQSLGVDYGMVQKVLSSSSAPAASPAEVVETIAPRTPPAPDKTLPGEDTKEQDVTIEQAPTAQKQEKAALQPFGYELFAGSPSTFAPATNIPVPLDYVIGPGDTVVVQLYGKENGTHELMVTREGMLQFPGIGPITVNGLNFEELKARIEQLAAEQMIGIKTSVTMGALRSIRVFVLGEAYKPGAYTVSALSTITNAIFASGGVTQVASLRNIQLKRQGKAVSSLDLYDLLLKGDTSKDARLLPGDVIFIPPVAKTAGITGQVKRPAIYEFKENLTAAQLVELAGGYTPAAYPKASRIDRINAKKERTIVDVDLLKQGAQPLKNGDLLHVYSVLDRVEDAVVVTGHVHRPGGFQWRKELRVSNVIRSFADLRPNPDKEFALIKRDDRIDGRISVLRVNLLQALRQPGSVHDLLLKPRDEIITFGLEQDHAHVVAPLVQQLRGQAAVDEYPNVVEILGHVKYPGAYPLTEKMTLADLIAATGGLKVEAELDTALYSSRDKKDGKVSVKQIALKDPQAQTLALEPLNEFYIFPKNGQRQGLLDGLINQLWSQVDKEEQAQVVSVMGAVKHPGVYPLTDQMTVSDLIAAAGGFMREAELNTALYSKRNEKNDKVSVQRLALEDPEAQILTLEPRDKLYIFSRNAHRQDLLADLVGQLQSQADKTQQLRLVSVTGAVKFPGDYPLLSGMKVGDLIDIAGGFSETAYDLQAEITRKTIDADQNFEIDHLPVDIQKQDAGYQIPLQSRDQLVIKRIPKWEDTRIVSVEGEVRFPGNYPITEGETLQNIIKRAGGLTDQADAKSAIFLRESLKEKEQEALERYQLQLQKELAALEKKAAMEEAKLAQAQMAGAQILMQLGQAAPTGRMVIDLPAILKGENKTPILLREGDQIIIPTFIQEVAVVGEVQFPTAHLYNRKTKAKEYIDLSGGYSRLADTKRAYVIMSDGSVKPLRKRVLFVFGKNKRIEPGDTIVVPADIAQVGALVYWSRVSQILFQLSTTAAALKTVGAF